MRPRRLLVLLRGINVPVFFAQTNYFLNFLLVDHICASQPIHISSSLGTLFQPQFFIKLHLAINEMVARQSRSQAKEIDEILFIYLDHLNANSELDIVFLGSGTLHIICFLLNCFENLLGYFGYNTSLLFLAATIH